MNQEDENIMELMKQELDIMSKLNHGNVVNQISHGKEVYKKKDKERVVNYIALEICEAGELFDLIAHGGAFSENVARHYFKQFMNGLKYCHDEGICHRDLKPENLLLDQNFDLKIADFGFASLIERED